MALARSKDRRHLHPPRTMTCCVTGYAGYEPSRGPEADAQTTLGSSWAGERQRRACRVFRSSAGRLGSRRCQAYKQRICHGLDTGLGPSKMLVRNQATDLASGPSISLIGRLRAQRANKPSVGTSMPFACSVRSRRVVFFSSAAAMSLPPSVLMWLCEMSDNTQRRRHLVK